MCRQHAEGSRFGAGHMVPAQNTLESTQAGKPRVAYPRKKPFEPYILHYEPPTPLPMLLKNVIKRTEGPQNRWLSQVVLLVAFRAGAGREGGRDQVRRARDDVMESARACSYYSS